MGFSVVIPVDDDPSVVDRMQRMREWLDHRRFEPSAFTYGCNGYGTVVRVDFFVEVEAAEFAQASQGHMDGAFADK